MSNLEKSPDLSTNNIEQTAKLRASYTRNFFSKQGETALQQFVDNLKKKPFNITIDPSDDKSLTLGVCALQKQLGFPDIDKALGCDGKFGPHTYKHYQGKLIKTDTHSSLEDLANISTPQIQRDVNSPKDQKETEPSSTDKTILVGDSITVGYSKYMKNAKSGFKGGKSTTWMRNNFLSNYVQKNAQGKQELKPEYQDDKPKNVVILGGVNDIMNGASVNSIINNIRIMAQTSQEVGLQVSVCTLPKWDTSKWSDFYVKQWKTWHKEKGGTSWNNGVYPYTGAMLSTATDRLNSQIRKLASEGIKVIDLDTEMTDTNKYPRVDGLHPSPQGAKAMAQYIKKQTTTFEKV